MDRLTTSNNIGVFLKYMLF